MMCGCNLKDIGFVHGYIAFTSKDNLACSVSAKLRYFRQNSKNNAICVFVKLLLELHVN